MRREATVLRQAGLGAGKIGGVSIPGLDAELATVDWTALHYSHGPTRLDEVIRGVLVGDPRDLRRGLSDWFNAVWHQGTRWSSAAPSVPFVARALERGSADDIQEILRLLLLVATGFPAECARTAQVPACDAAGRAAFLAVSDAVPAVSRLLDHVDPAVRRKVAFFLGWFPDHADRSSERLGGLLATDDDPACRAAATIAMALLQRATGGQGTEPGVHADILGAPAERAARAIAAVLEASSPSAGAVRQLVDHLLDEEPWPVLDTIWEEDGLVAAMAWALVDQAHGTMRQSASRRFEERTGLGLDAFKAACWDAFRLDLHRRLVETPDPAPMTTAELGAWNDISQLRGRQEGDPSA